MRSYMTTLMIAPMAITMLLFMRGMYPDKKLNALILGGALLVGVGIFVAMRQQTAVDDVAWMRAMISHHSSAILVSEEAALSDPEVKRLAVEIVEAQRREIAQMEAMIARLND